MPSKPSAAPRKKVSQTPASPTSRAPTAGTRPTPLAPPSAPSRTLDAFANPEPGRDYLIRFEIPEFTCLCPLTGQPDFAQFRIDCVADALCIELKSLKLYMWSYRNDGAFHEKVTNDIVSDIVEAIQPRYLRVDATWNVRGGITTHMVVEHRKKGWQGAVPERRAER